MPRACSKLVMLLLTLLLTLSMASSALAQGKKKKKAAADKAETAEEATPAEGKEGKSTDDLMGEATKGKPKAAAGDDEKAPAADADSELQTQETPTEPDSWERPPEEAEKPKREVAASLEEQVGDGRPWMVGLILGYGMKTDSDTGALGADPYGPTAGLRGGYTLDFNLYVGVFFQYYLGSTETGRQARVNTGESETTASALQFGAEAGYDFWLGEVILRPSLQLGASMAFTDRSGENVSMSDFIAGPGLGLIVPMDGWFLGGELRPILPFANAPVVLLIGVHGGLRFE